MKVLAALALLAVATVSAQHGHGGDGRMTCPQAGYMYPDPENLCFVHFCAAPGEPAIKRMCPKGVRVPTWWEGGFLNMCFIANIVKHHGEPVCLRCDAYDIPPQTEGCASNPCDAGCTCEDTEYTFRCDCPDTGIYTPVETVPMPVNHCEPDPCENGAVCQNQWDGYFCICPNGWTGHRCETSVCDWHGCFNGGTCVIDEIGWHCDCTDCYTGSCCTEEVPECNVVPTNAPEPESAVECPPCYEGPDCADRIDSCGCKLEDLCVDSYCVDGPDGTLCQACDDCMTGPECKVRKDTCECTKTPCPENSRCENLSDVESHECFCDDCWEGPRCNKRKNTCECDNKCPEGAQCYDDEVAGPSCSCGDCLKGRKCDEPIVSCNCNSPCEDYETCEMVGGSPTCSCSDPCRTGENCDVVVSSCACSDPCVNGGTCDDSTGDLLCNDCDDCYTGPYCGEKVVSCDCGSPCEENEYCEMVDGSPVCGCSDPCRTGENCDVVVSSCACSDPCVNGGKCYQENGDLLCNDCDYCYTGPTCADKVQSCDCQNDCVAPYTCTDLENGPLCGCPACYEGDNCDIPTNDCTCNNPCKEESMCRIGDDGPYCECDCQGDEVCFQNVVTGIPECRCPPCKRNAYGERGCGSDITNLCECNDCTGDQEVCTDGEDEDGGVVCKIGNPSSGNAFTVVFEENDTERSFKEIPLELYITGAVWNSGTRFVNIKSAGLKEGHHCYFNVNVTVPENKVERFTVERCMMQNGTGLERLAITLTEMNNLTMTVYGVNKDRWTADAFLAIPDAMAGKTFQTVSYSPAHISSQFAIAVLYDDTEVTIKLADDNDLPSPYNVKGAVLKQTLSAFDTFQVQARCKGQRPSKKRRCNLDLTGSAISSNKPIHVFSGNVRAFIPAGEAFSRDHLVEELVPVDRWGMDFGLISIPGRVIGDLLQIMAVDMVETQVFIYSTVNGKSTKDVYSLPIDGKYHTTIEIPSNGRFFLKSSEKLSVTQYTKSRDDYQHRNESFHDPVSITVPPIQQFTNNFFISNPMFTGGEKFHLQPYNSTFALLVAKSGEEGDIVLNDQAISKFISPWGPLPSSEDPDDPALVAAVVEVPAEAYATNVIRNTEGKNFQCLIYGYDDRESYGMPAAMALAKLRV